MQTITNYFGQYTGDGLSVVIIDTGSSSQFINENVVYAYDFADSDDDVSSSIYFHGGAVAQVAQTVASDTNIIHLKVLSDNSDSATLEHIEKALQWVTQNEAEYNIVSVNLSFGDDNIDEYLPDGEWILGDEYQILDNLDIVTTVAAGNEGQNYLYDGVNYLAASDHVIAVSATDSNNEFTSFTQKDEKLTDISALGEDVPVNGYSLSGTSFSSPIIAGAVAIIQQIALEELGHKISDEEFLDLIQKTADKINPDSYSSNDQDSNTNNGMQLTLPNTEGLFLISPDSDPGASKETAYVLDSKTTNVVIADSLGYSGDYDDKDYYSFILDNDAETTFDLTGLSSDVDLILKDAYDNTLIHEWEWGNADLSITASLKADEIYYIVADIWDGKDTDYTLSIDFNGGFNQAPDAPEEPSLPDISYISPDSDPGASKETAYVLDSKTTNVVIADSLGYSGDYDDKDYYSFILDNDAETTFDLTGLSSDVDLILKDAYDNTLIHEWEWGNADLSITASLKADEIYYIVADIWDGKDTDYTLSIDFNGGFNQAPDAPEEPSLSDISYISPDSDPGASKETAYVLDSKTTNVVIADSLGYSGDYDDKDYYSFILDNDAETTFDLTGLSSDVDLILKDAYDNTLIHEWEWGNADLSITASLKADEIYYIVADIWDGKDTDYTLSIDFNGGFEGGSDTPEPDIPETPAIPEEPDTPLGYASINIANAVDYFQENLQDYAVV